MEYQDWKKNVKISIFSSMITQQVMQHMNSGNGYPTEEEMKLFAEHAEEIVKIWKKSYKINSEVWQLYWKF